MSIKVNAFVAVNENVDLGVSEDDKLVLVTTVGNQKSISTIGNMSDYTFKGVRMALDRLETFKTDKTTITDLSSKDEIKPNGFYDTPESMRDLESRLNNYSGEERAVAWLGAMLAWNYACAVTSS